MRGRGRPLKVETRVRTPLGVHYKAQVGAKSGRWPGVFVALGESTAGGRKCSFPGAASGSPDSARVGLRQMHRPARGELSRAASTSPALQCGGRSRPRRSSTPPAPAKNDNEADRLQPGGLRSKPLATPRSGRLGVKALADGRSHGSSTPTTTGAATAAAKCSDPSPTSSSSPNTPPRQPNGTGRRETSLSVAS